MMKALIEVVPLFTKDQVEEFLGLPVAPETEMGRAMVLIFQIFSRFSLDRLANRRASPMPSIVNWQRLRERGWRLQLPPLPVKYRLQVNHEFAVTECRSCMSKASTDVN
jgi:hypothetical protein